MKLAFEIVAVWTLLNFVVGIPVWMLVKLRDRREMVAQGLDWEDSFASESNSGFATAGPSKPAQSNQSLPSHGIPSHGIPSHGIPNPGLPRVVAGRLVPDAGAAVMGAVGRVSTDNRSVTDV